MASTEKRLPPFSDDTKFESFTADPWERRYGKGSTTLHGRSGQVQRKIFDATEPTPLTTDLLSRIGQLYEIEAEVRGQQPDNQRPGWQDRTKPMIDELRRLSTAPYAASRPSPRWPRRSLTAANARSR